ncbi:Peptidase T2, asparaginase 2 [Penicillium griseofulvum]|uniref:beta-aspartyl-peptidase n=1 Tax=Penicillium patulum TaxID=5078 RepID=A0A135M0D7_PENPA|nr:Peptidase T2, asparaginase 2 [Penicillium griseofulvum]KXG54682.1 Peptidase T2, asparaginase 2 [Penicillium griseofulvum]
MSYSIVLHAGAADSWAGESQLQEKTEFFLHHLINGAEDKLRNGESALQVVTEVVSALEDYPQFNAGKGSALNNDGFHELEAAVIDGRTCRYRAAGGLQRTKNPIKLAHKMLDFPAPALIIGNAADELAETNGLDMVDNSYFTTDSRRVYWEAKMNKLLENHGTVGAVALDIYGNLAAANSTGGVTFKHRGRIGDTAIVGAGIYADDEVAVVCSGSGDAILQATVAGRAAAATRSGTKLNDAVEKAILKSAELYPDSSCGVIAIDASGSISIHCNSRIFAVASASSSQPEWAGIARSTIPILSQLAIFENEKIIAGMVKYPTFPNQIVVCSQPREPILSLEAEPFVDFFIRLRRVIRKVQSFYQAPDIAFITCGKTSSAFVFPLSISTQYMDIDLKDDDYTTTYRPLSDGHRADFHYVDDRLIKVRIHRPDKAGLFSTELQQYSQTILQIWTILQVLSREVGPDASRPHLEVHPQRKGHVTIFLGMPHPSSFPKPATFCDSLPGYLTPELGPKVADMASLGRLAGKMAEYLTSSSI